MLVVPVISVVVVGGQVEIRQSRYLQVCKRRSVGRGHEPLNIRKVEVH